MSDLKHTPEQTLAAVVAYDAAQRQATIDMVEDDRDVAGWLGAVNAAAARIAAAHGMSEAYLEVAWNAWRRLEERAA